MSEENFRRYGASTTPTLVLVDRAGIVRLYHPGAMSYEELRARVASLVEKPRASYAGVVEIAPFGIEADRSEHSS